MGSLAFLQKSQEWEEAGEAWDAHKTREEGTAEVGWGEGLGNLWGATYQEVEAVLDLLEAVDVMCLCYPCRKKWEGGGSQIIPRLSPHSSPLALNTHPPDALSVSSSVSSSYDWCLTGPPSAFP